MPRRVMIAPVGFEFDAVVEAQRHERCGVWYVLADGEGSGTAAEAARWFSQKVTDRLARWPLEAVHTVQVSQTSLLDLAGAMAAVIRGEREVDPYVEFVFNASGSTNMAALAASLVASLVESRCHIVCIEGEGSSVLDFLEISDVETGDFESIKAAVEQFRGVRQEFLEHGLSRAPFQVSSPPVLKFRNFPGYQKEVLLVVAGGSPDFWFPTVLAVFESFWARLREAEPEQETKRSRRAHRIRVGYSLGALERSRLVHIRKVGRKKEVRITPEGLVVARIISELGVV